ncbi:MAG: glycosyltransferase family 39 protein [Desulfobacterales bacterium]
MAIVRRQVARRFPGGLLWLLPVSAALNGMVWLQRGNTAVNHDALTYLAASQVIAAGGWTDAAAIHPILAYPWLISLLHPLLPDWVSAGRMVSCLAVVAAVVPVYLLSRDLFGEQAARWSALLFTVAPDTLRFSFQVIRDPLFGLFFLWFVFWGARALESGLHRHSLLAALSALFAALIRPEGAMAFPLFVVFCLGAALLRPREWKRRLKPTVVWFASLCLVAVVARVAGPVWLSFTTRANPYYTDYLLDLSGGKGFHNLERIRHRLQILEQESTYEIAGENFASLARRLIPWIFFGGMIAGCVKAFSFSTCLAAGIGLSRFRCGLRHLFVLWVILGYASFIYLFVLYRDFFDTRFVYVPLAALMPWAGWGIVRTLSRLSGRRGGAMLSLTAAALVVLIPLSKSNHLFMKGPPDALVEAAAWLAGRQDLLGARWMATDDRIPFYVGRQRLPLRNEVPCRKIFTIDYACLEETAARQGIEIVAVYAEKGRLEGPGTLKGYEVIREFADGKRTVTVWRRSPGERPSAQGGG